MTIVVSLPFRLHLFLYLIKFTDYCELKMIYLLRTINNEQNELKIRETKYVLTVFQKYSP